jgi:hypothetical protein
MRSNRVKERLTVNEMLQQAGYNPKFPTSSNTVKPDGRQMKVHTNLGRMAVNLIFYLCSPG